MVTAVESAAITSDYAEMARRPLEAEQCALVVIDIQQKLLPPIFQIAALLPETEPIDKTPFSCFGSDVFCSLLKRLPGPRTTLLLCGMESHICVTQTALGALREGYLVHVASDAVSSRTEWNWKIGLERMRAAGAIISSTEMMIYELMRSSSSAAFKELLPHLKG